MDGWHTFVLYASASIFLFFFGSTVGSFLNVVIYRLPAGLNLVRPNSRCPRCEHPIRARDNIPVLGWIVLRGQCRDCGVRIPLRYPLVELFFGLFVLALGHRQLLSAGANLPFLRQGAYADAFEVASWHWHWPLTAIFVYHCVYFACAFSCAMIRYDGHPLPVRLMQFALAFGLAIPLFGPEIRPAYWGYPWVAEQFEMLGAVWDGLAGLFCGWLLGMTLRSSTPPSDRDRVTPDIEFSLAAAGVYFGWQAVLSIAVFAPWAMIALPSVLRAKTSWCAAIGATSLAVLIVWSDLFRIPGWPGASREPYGYFAAVAAFLGACVLIRFGYACTGQSDKPCGENAD